MIHSPWLNPQRRPLWDTTRPDLPIADCRKVTTMTKNNAAMTTNNKENTMTITMPEKKYVNLATKIQLHDDWFTIVSAADVTPTDPIVNCCPDKKPTNLTNDPVELEFLRYVCAYFGWGNELCTKSQAEDNGGTLKEGAQGWPAVWKEQTTKAGKTSTYCQFVFPKEAFEWKDGAPAYDEEKKLREAVDKAKKQLAKAEKELDMFLHPEKYAKKPKQPTKAQLQAQNDALMAALKAAGIDLASIA